MKVQYAIVVVMGLGSYCLRPAGAQNYVSIGYPGASHSFAGDLDDGQIVGTYGQALGQYRGFLWDGTNYSTLVVPGSLSTVPQGIDGGMIVGSYRDSTSRSHGFLYDGSGFQTLDPPQTNPLLANGSEASGISGNRIVGVYIDNAAKTHGYIYDGTTYATIDFPNAAVTTASGIDGTQIVGSYSLGGKLFGYLFDGTTFRTIEHPLGAKATLALDVSGSRVVGYYVDSAFKTHGYVFDGTHYVTLDVPASLGTDTIANGISGDLIVGQYISPLGHRGFVLIAEPSSVSVVSIVLLGCVARRPSRWQAN